ncbi:Non-specific serine/threonine protein kinase [Bertholletia excelsa]
MEKKTRRGMMEQRKIYEQVHYGSGENRNEGLSSANQRLFQDPSSSINTNMRPPDFNKPVSARPVLNYSIQTGEEFALEFMIGANSRQHFIANPSGETNSKTNYTDLKGILGISHAGSESGSDISMISSMDKGHGQECKGRGSSIQEDKGYYESTQSVPRPLSRNDRGSRAYTSSEVSENSSTKVKFLCSFGGKILPRPSDGKLRYVGGETRIIRLSKDISWQELMQKISIIYNQVHTIKYQLPGEDLDALVSVSSDEDLQNMMEECCMLGGGGSQKLRMFLFSSSDLDDSLLGLSNADGDSEIQYVVAVNGMDVESRKSSIGLGSTSGNNLDELLNLNVERNTGHVADELARVLPAHLAATMPISSNIPTNTYESDPQVYHGQLVDHSSESHALPGLHHREDVHHDGNSTFPLSIPPQYGRVSHTSSHAAVQESLVLTPLHGHMAGQEGSSQQQRYNSSHARDAEVSIKEEKVKRDCVVQTVNELEKNYSLEKEILMKEPKMKRDNSIQKINDGKNLYLGKESVTSSNPHDSPVLNYIPSEASDGKITADTGGFMLPTEWRMRHNEPGRDTIQSGAFYDGNENDQFSASGKPFVPRCGEEADPAEPSYLEQPVLLQRVFHSERIPREQTELNRLSKSEDSFDPQVLITHARADLSQQMAESVDKLHDGIMESQSQSEQFASPIKPLPVNAQTVEDGATQSEKYEAADKMNPKNLGEPFESKFQNSVLKPVILTPGDGHEMSRLVNTYRDQSDRETSAVNNPVVSRGPSGKRLEDSASRAQETHWSEMAVKKNTGNNPEENVRSVALVENPVRLPSQSDPACIGAPGQKDIRIDINERFSPDFFSDIFAMVRNSEDVAALSPLHHDGAGLSLNMENHEPKRWSFFKKLVQSDFVRKDVSLIDQDHLGLSSPLTNVEVASVDYTFPSSKTEGVALGPVNSRIDYESNLQPQSSVAVGPDTMDVHLGNSPQIKGNERTHFNALVNPGTPESDTEDGKLEVQHDATPLNVPSLGEFDLSSLQIIKDEDLEELRELGSGTFGTVYHGKWRGTDVAIKRIKKACFTGRSSEQERLTVEFWREAAILSKLHHPNVVAFYGVVQDGPGGTLATVTEFMVNGSLRHVLLCKDRQLDRRKRLMLAMDAAFGMEYLHSKNIVHFDLKCDNLLVNLKDPSRPICKVGDFGLSKIKRNTLVTGGVRGTLPWMAPELLNGSSNKVSEKVDVFSFGIVLWEILTGEEPYANMHYGAIIGGIVNNTLRPPVPNYCDSEWKLLMEQCWAPDPVVRPSFTEIARRLRVMSAACQTKPHGHNTQNQVTK